MNEKLKLQEDLLQLICDFEDSTGEKVTRVDMFVAEFVGKDGTVKDFPSSRALKVTLKEPNG